MNQSIANEDVNHEAPLCAVTNQTSAMAVADGKLLTVPKVTSYEEDGIGTFTIGATSGLVLLLNDFTAGNNEAELVVQLVCSAFAAKSVPDSSVLPVVPATEVNVQSGDVVFRLTGLDGSESVRITIGKNIEIEASSLRGLLYGGRTVLQLAISTGNRIPTGVIVDRPVISERAVHVDVGRKFFTKEWMLNQIRDFSWMKYNTLQIHFSENEGFRIESESHPEVMSDEYWTKAEVREILALAKRYQMDVIPSLDSPGHLQQALSRHPDYCLPDSNGERITTALDITNTDARNFVKELLDEYADLFVDSKYFHMGADEFIVFDKYSNYPKLEEYAKVKLGQSATGVDTFYDYINDIAEHLEKLGFVVRAWNDGLYRIGQAYVVELKKSIEICYWTSWDPNMAAVQTFLDEGHTVINYNDAYFYYVLGETAGYTYPTAEKIFDAWSPGLFPSRNSQVGSDTKQEYEYPYSEVGGTSFSIWCDKPEDQTEAEIARGLYEPLRAKIERDWNGKATVVAYEEFKTLFNRIGRAPGYDEALPDSGDIVR